MFPPPSRSLLARPEVHDSLRGRRIKGQAGRARDGHLALALGQRRAKAGAAERLRLRQVLPPVGVFIFPADYVFNTVQDPTCLRFNSRFNCQSAFRQGSMCYCAASPLLFFSLCFFLCFFFSILDGAFFFSLCFFLCFFFSILDGAYARRDLSFGVK